MEKIQQTKEYKTPQFHLVSQNEQNKVFFAASTPTPTGPSGSLSSMTSTTGGWV